MKWYNRAMIDDSGHRKKIWPALSAVKFVCLAVLIFVHAHVALVTNSGVFVNPFGIFYKITSNLMYLGLFLIALPIIAGAVLRMDLDKGFIQDKLKNDYRLGGIIKIATFLSLAGFFMNMITFGIGYTFSWNVLQLIGLSFIVIVFLLKKFSVRAVGWFGLAVLLVADPLRNILGNWDHLYFVGIFIGVHNAFIFWPFFPWFGVVVFGFLVAHYYLKYQDSVKFRVGLFAAGAILLSLAVSRGEASPYLDPNYVWGPSIFQPKIGWVLAALGLFCLLVVVANTFLNNSRFSKYGIINSYSKGILWIYVAQMFASQKLSWLVKDFFPMDEPSLAYFILPVVLLGLGWLIGALSIRFLQEKSIVIKLKRTQ